MGKAKLIFAFALLMVVVAIAWQIASAEIANAELQSDLRDISSQVASRIGLEAPSSDEDLRNAVVHKAAEYDIPLQPEQVTVQRTGTGKAATVYLAADYSARVNLFVFSFTLHFTPSSTK